MRHRVRGRKLGRNASHRKAMFRNMASSFIKTLAEYDDEDPLRPYNPGRIITTVPKAKELRPYIEKLITLAKSALPHKAAAAELAPTAERNSSEWLSWRKSAAWQEWAQATAPALALQRRAFSILRDQEAVRILFDVLAPRFADRPGGYTRVVTLAKVRLGDSGKQAMIEFVGDPETDRPGKTRQAEMPVVADEEPTKTPAAETAEEKSVDAPEPEAAADEATDSAEEKSD